MKHSFDEHDGKVPNPSETKLVETPRTVEERLAEWAKQPGAFVSDAERHFIEYMRAARMRGVGFGWMQQVIEWEWQSTGPAPWGPEYFNRKLASLADELRLARERVAELEVELAASDGVAFNLSEHAKCMEKDAERYGWLQDWYLREGKRSEIDEFGHIRQTTALIMDASIDAALKDAASSGPKD